MNIVFIQSIDSSLLLEIDKYKYLPQLWQPISPGLTNQQWIIEKQFPSMIHPLTDRSYVLSLNGNNITFSRLEECINPFWFTEFGSIKTSEDVYLTIAEDGQSLCLTAKKVVEHDDLMNEVYLWRVKMSFSQLTPPRISFVRN